MITVYIQFYFRPRPPLSDTTLPIMERKDKLRLKVTTLKVKVDLKVNQTSHLNKTIQWNQTHRLRTMKLTSTDGM